MFYFSDSYCLQVELSSEPSTKFPGSEPDSPSSALDIAPPGTSTAVRSGKYNCNHNPILLLSSLHTPSLQIPRFCPLPPTHLSSYSQSISFSRDFLSTEQSTSSPEQEALMMPGARKLTLIILFYNHLHHHHPSSHHHHRISQALIHLFTEYTFYLFLCVPGDPNI